MTQEMLMRVEHLLGNFLDKLDYRIQTLDHTCMEKWKEGYKVGFEDGRQS